MKSEYLVALWMDIDKLTFDMGKLIMKSHFVWQQAHCYGYVWCDYTCKYKNLYNDAHQLGWLRVMW